MGADAITPHLLRLAKVCRRNRGITGRGSHGPTILIRQAGTNLPVFEALLNEILNRLDLKQYMLQVSNEQETGPRK
jgi:hypothetical protein